MDAKRIKDLAREAKQLERASKVTWWPRACSLQCRPDLCRAGFVPLLPRSSMACPRYAASTCGRRGSIGTCRRARLRRAGPHAPAFQAYPRGKLHLVCDNYATHPHPKVQTWRERNPRIMHSPHVRVVADHGRELLGHHHPAGRPPRHIHQRKGLITAIVTYVDAGNERCETFVWSKLDDILTKVTRGKRPSFTASLVLRP